VVKVKRSDGSTLWVAGGQKATVTGDSWKGSEHGIHLLGPNQFLLFNNNSRAVAGGMGSAGGDGTGSIAIEYKVDPTAKKITEVWRYKSTIQNDIMGDVQRMDNGNTIMAFSTKGKLQEISANGTVLEEWSWQGSTSSYGYIEKRASLYGPPPK
jgi:Arylsulfotransferase (ASST)